MAAWKFGRAILLAVAAMIVVVPSLTWFIFDQRDAEQAADDQREVDTNYRNCLHGNEIRELLIEAEKEPGQVLDLTVLPSVQNAPSWFQDVTAELKALSEQAAAAEIDPGSRTGRRIARYEAQIRDCPAEYPNRTPGVTLSHEEQAQLRALIVDGKQPS